MSIDQQRRGAALVAASGALILGAGLLLGPTPRDDPAGALRDIDGFRTEYVLTNTIDLVGILIMGAGLILLGRLQLLTGGGAVALLGSVANAAGAALIALTVVLQSSVDPLVAERFVTAGPTDEAALLVIGEAAMETSGAVFGVGFLLQMIGIGLFAAGWLLVTSPRLNRLLLLAGALLAFGASTMGVAALFDDAFGDLEALLGLTVLLWLVFLSAFLVRPSKE